MASALGVATTLLVCLAPAAATLRGADGHKGLSAADMHPKVVSRLLSSVERDWEGQALAALLGQTSEASALTKVQKSCQEVTKSIVDGASGGKDRVVEYMKDVCNEDQDQHDLHICGEFSKAVESFMTDDEFHNREELNYDDFCTGFYGSTVVGEVKAAADAKKAEEASARTAEADAQLANEAQLAQKDAARTHADEVAAANKVEVAQMEAKKAYSMTEGLAKDEEAAQHLTDAAQKLAAISDDKEVVEEDAKAKAKAAEERARAKRREIEEKRHRTSVGVALAATRRINAAPTKVH